MGVAVQLVLGLLFLCSGWIHETLSSEYNTSTTQSPLHDERHINLIEKLPKTDTDVKYVNKNTHLRTNHSEPSILSEIDPKNSQNLRTNNVEKDSEKDNSLKKDGTVKRNRDDNSRSIDIERYVSPEFQNNVFTIPMSSDTEKYLEEPYSFKSSTGKGADYAEFDLTTPRTAFFDNKYTEAIQKLEQEYEARNDNEHEYGSHDDDDHESSHDHDLEHDHEDDIHDHEMEHEHPRDDADEDLNPPTSSNDSVDHPKNISENIKQIKIMRDYTVDKNTGRNDTTVTVVHVRKLDYVTNFNDTQIFNYDDSKEDPATANATTPKAFVATTRKNVILTKPPIDRNNSHILSNKIETETIKAINLVTTELPKRGNDISEETSKESARRHEINSVHSLFPIKDEETTAKAVSEVQQSTVTTKRAVTSSTSPTTTTAKIDIAPRNEFVTETTRVAESTVETTAKVIEVTKDQLTSSAMDINGFKTDAAAATTTETEESTSVKYTYPTTMVNTETETADGRITEPVTEIKTTETVTTESNEVPTSEREATELPTTEVQTSEPQTTEPQTTEWQARETETAKVQPIDRHYFNKETTEIRITENPTTEPPEVQSTFREDSTTENQSGITTVVTGKTEYLTTENEYGEKQSRDNTSPETTTFERTTEFVNKRLNTDQSKVFTEITTMNEKYEVSTHANKVTTNAPTELKTDTAPPTKLPSVSVEPKILGEQTTITQQVTTESNSVRIDVVNAPNSKQTTEHSKERIYVGETAGQTTTEELEFPTETSSATENIVIDPDEGKGKVAAIAISCVGAICLVLLAGLLYIMRKRQKRFNYIQNCRPVSLDDYSVDTVSVYNSVRRKGIDRQSKRSYGNPAFDDPNSPTHPLNFPALAKFATNVDDMKAEFEDIPQISARTSELPDGCETKNRYANVIPLPETRVFLKSIDGFANSDYINANYVTGPKDTKGYYIACQGPMQNTVDDFWRMIWEQNSKVILMITHLFENGVEKCADYLPPSEVLDCHRLFGDFQVTLKKRDVKEKYIISSLQLKNMVSNSWREVTHFWYLGWPEKGIPTEANSLIAFLIEARSYMKTSTLDKNASSNGNISTSHSGNDINPVVVHCSPGTGRTGVVIACDIAIREFEQTRLVDIPKIVYRIRRDRASAVQTKEQYMFIYKVVSLYATKLTGGALDSF